jgi:hypothetical protein
VKGKELNVPGEYYEIKIKGNLHGPVSDWFEGMTVINFDDGKAVLSGYLQDQSALHGILMKIRDLGLPLLDVRRVDPEHYNDEQ